MYKEKNRGMKSILDARGRRYTLAYCIFIVATVFFLIIPLIWMIFDWIDGDLFEKCMMYYTILVGTDCLVFIGGVSHSKKYKNGNGSVTK